MGGAIRRYRTDDEESASPHADVAGRAHRGGVEHERGGEVVGEARFRHAPYLARQMSDYRLRKPKKFEHRGVNEDLSHSRLPSVSPSSGEEIQANNK